MSAGIKVTAVRKKNVFSDQGSVILRSGVNSYLTLDRADLDALIMKLCIVRDTPIEAFDDIEVDGKTCVVEKLI